MHTWLFAAECVEIGPKDELLGYEYEWSLTPLKERGKEELGCWKTLIVSPLDMV